MRRNRVHLIECVRLRAIELAELSANNQDPHSKAMILASISPDKQEEILNLLEKWGVCLNNPDEIAGTPQL